MDLIVTSTGRVFYQVNDELASVLIEAFPTVFERRARAAAPPVPPSWKIGKMTGTDYDSYFVEYKIGSRVERYVGKPEDLVATFARMNVTVPDDIANRYQQMYVAPPAPQYVTRSE